MAINIKMPSMTDTMTEGVLLKWHVKKGDKVEIGDVLADLETDKATMEMAAFDEGEILSLEVEEGAKVTVGATLAKLSGEGKDEEAAPAKPAASASDKPAENKSSDKAAPQVVQVRPAGATRSVKKSADEGRYKASPLAKKIAAEKGISLGDLTGSGPGGRIVSADVLEAKAKPASSGGGGQAAPSAPAIRPTVGEGDERVPLSTMRTVIASRLLTSKTTIPHFYLNVELDAAPLLAFRGQVNTASEATKGNKYTVNDFIMRAVVQSCIAVPAVNASFDGDAIVKFKHVGLSVAVAVEDGLVTPVIPKADTKTLLDLSLAIKDLAGKARNKKLSPAEMSGGTITISNLGAFGVDNFDAIINPPQAAILSIGAIRKVPVVNAAGQIVAGERMWIGLSCDHRVVDGAVGAQFLAEMKKLLEAPALMLI